MSIDDILQSMSLGKKSKCIHSASALKQQHNAAVQARYTAYIWH